MILIEVLSTLEVAAAAVDVATEVAAIVEVDWSYLQLQGSLMSRNKQHCTIFTANICNIEFFSHMQTIYFLASTAMYWISNKK